MAAAWKRSEAANCFFESAGLGTEANERSTPKKKCWVLALSYISNNRHGVCPWMSNSFSCPLYQKNI